MNKTLFVLGAALPALALAAAPPGPTEMQHTADQPVLHRPDDTDAKTERPRAEPVTPKKDSAADARLSAKDIEALGKLHAANQDEISMGQLAKKSGDSKQVKAFGDMLIKDHSLADKQVVAFAKKAGIELAPPAPKDEQELAEHHAHMDTMKRIETLKGEEFDRAFIKMMVEGHQQAVNLIESTLTATQDSQLHSMLSKILPVIKEHLRVAEQINKRVGSV